jgi:protease IV
MFSRRHPFLFFSLIMCAICASAFIFISLIVASAVNSSNRNSSFYAAKGDLVGIIDVTGVIADSRNVINQIKQLRENKSVKAVVLRIDSPGGTVGPAQEIYREVRKTIGTKKIVVSMGTVAASGGYYIAAAADGIMANPGTITGSIGVIIEYTNFKQLLDKIGVASVVIKSGDFKDVGSPVREMTEKEETFLQNFVDQTRQQFVRAVADGRKMPIEQVESLADGRIFTGEEAKENGLVDRLGNLEDAIEWAGRMAGIEGKINTIYLHEKRFTFLEELLGASQKSFINRIFQRYPLASYIMGPSD